jgi:hypothetical protein
MLYRLLKKANQSSRTFFSLSPKSSHSGLQSSGFNDDCANALEASLPTKTARRYRSVKPSHERQQDVCSRGSRVTPEHSRPRFSVLNGTTQRCNTVKREREGKVTVITATLRVRCVAGDFEDGSLMEASESKVLILGE